MTVRTKSSPLDEDTSFDRGPFSEGQETGFKPAIRREGRLLEAEPAAFLKTVSSRRSIGPKRLIAPGPSRDELDAIISAGLTAPDHCLLRPWRFLRIPDARRVALADLFAQEKRLTHPGATDLEVETERVRAFNAPTLIAIVIVLTENFPKVPIHEQYISLGAAVENILLAAHALGFGAIMTSGRKIESPLLQSAFCRTPSERLIGFLSIGTPTRAPKTRIPAVLGDHFADWTG